MFIYNNIIVWEISNLPTLICEVTPENWCKRLPHVFKVFSEKWFYAPGSDINLLPWDQCHKSSQSQLSQWQMPYWLIFDRFLKSAKISSSEFWDHLVFQMENETTDLMHRRIHWLGGSWYCCRTVLCTQPDFGLVGLSSLVPDFCSCSTAVGHIDHDPRLTFLRSNPSHVIAFSCGPPWCDLQCWWCS